MENRKYFKHTIVQLEALYEHSGGDCGILEELEEELSFRSTQRAQKLLAGVQKTLASHAPNIPISQSAPSNQSTPKNDTHKNESIQINWETVLSGLSAAPEQSHLEKPLKNIPVDILDAWTILEALSPQSYKKPNDLVIGAGSVAYLKSGHEPWIAGEKSKPKNNLYYMVYLGAIDLERATEQLLSVYQDKRIERPAARGFAALGVVLLDKGGVPVPETGLALSSFGWSYARALQGRLEELKSWEKAEKALKEGLESIIYQQDKNGEVLPFSLAQAVQAFNWLVRNCEIPAQDCITPSFTIRHYQPFSKGEPETPLLNSFFLDDLQRVKPSVQTNSCGKALKQYLGMVKREHEFDVLKDKQHIENILQPKSMPAGRWPSNGRHSLVLLQQTAVNLAIQELKNGGLFSVNGPPGTGKTTLLRDIVAHVLVERATALYAFQSTDDAFEHVGQMKLGNGFVHLYKLHESLRGHEIVVASTNNKAVENVSKELPLREQIAQDITDLNYFSAISDALSPDGVKTWGLIAAVLGNSKNRGAFINHAWWDNDTGLRNYFLSITGQFNPELDDEENEIIPKIISECDPPKNMQDAKLRWEQARKNFNKALGSAENAIVLAQKAHDAHKRAAALVADILHNKSLQDNQQIYHYDLQSLATELALEIDEKNEILAIATDKEQRLIKIKPGFFKRLFRRTQWSLWKADYAIAKVDLNKAQQACKECLLALKENEDSLLKSAKNSAELKAQEHVLNESRNKALAEIEKYAGICDGKLVTAELWSVSHEEQQTFKPNFRNEPQRLRDDVFIAAVKLHKAFIDVSAKQLRQNLSAFFSCLSGGSLPQDKQHLLPHLWSSAFLLTPVISTAFASVGRMLKELPQESIGWLLIDEAGQATPQAAIGAIYRAKRVMSVGDPLQIEPVVSLSPVLVEGISKYMGVDPYHWMAPNASVQTASDAANNYGTTIPRDLSEIRIGTPLLVHRRCENPMFTISNRLAYNGLMVHATAPKESALTNLFGVQTAWFDIRGSAEEKWCAQEGNHVCDMLIKACAHFSSDPDIFVISPFRIVAERMRQRMRAEATRLESYGISSSDDWINNNIGTVHTFQGKEAKGVILLLGAPSPAQTGARSWATSNVNLLNVAVSRAKQNFYVVGNKELWGDVGNMKLMCRYLK